MLVLTRRVEESIQIGKDITIKVIKIGPGKVRIGIEAPHKINIARSELIPTLPISSTQEEFEIEDKGVS